MMNESEMGNRVSKSNGLSFVKEQRVDGSCGCGFSFIPKPQPLRCTLMAHESGYQVRVLSNLNLRSISEPILKNTRLYSNASNQRLQP